MDAKISIVSEQEGAGFFIAQFKTSQLAIFSYYIESDGLSVLIDPTFDVKVYSQFIAKRNSTLSFVLLTHYHADFLSGHTQLKVPIIMGHGSKRQANQFQVKQYENGSSFDLGKVKIQVIHTPGHTLESSCFLLHDSNGKAECLFSGDTVFLGEVGRPDLAANSKLTKQDLAGLLFESIQQLKLLKDQIRVYPGHGAGSACGKAIGGGNFCTLANQKTGNYGFQFTDKGQFVKAVTDIAEPPKYFFYDAGLNQRGPVNYQSAVKNSNIPLSIDQFKNLAETLPIIDTRNDIGAGLIKGAYWLPSKGAITNWLASLLTPETDFIIICEKGKWEDIADRFLRIGYFNIKGYNGFDISEWKEQLNKPAIVNFEQFKQLNAVKHLDVRNQPEFESFGIIDDAIRIPLPVLPSKVNELKDNQNLVVSCRTGLRARVAFSILIREGISSTILAESFQNFAANGIKISPYTV